MPAFGDGEEGVDGAEMGVVGEILASRVLVVAGQSNCVVGGRVVQPQGRLVLVWTAYVLGEPPQTHQPGPFAMAAHEF